VKARGTPQRIVAAHSPDQVAEFLGNCQLTGFPAPGFPCLKQPLRCQAITVSGLTIISTDRQSSHAWDNQTQRNRSAGANFGRFTDRCKTPSWCRRARFSNWRAARDLKVAAAVTARTRTALTARRKKYRTGRKFHVLIRFEVCDRHNFR
jgi:hypothetical protein